LTKKLGVSGVFSQETLIKTLLPQKQSIIKQRDLVLMKIKTSALTIISILLVSLMVGMQSAKIARANFIGALPPRYTIQIESDGTVNPANAPINRIGNSYTLTDDLVNTTIHIECSNIMFDGANHTLSHQRIDIGVHLSAVNNVSVRNVRVAGFSYGVRFTNSFNCAVEGLTVTNCGYAIFLHWSPNSTLTKNNLDNNVNGIGIIMSNGSRIFSNNLSMSSWCAFYISGSQGNNIYQNNVVNNNRSTYFERESYEDPYTNFWDSSKIGNYWSDYNGTDSNGDGIGDSPYIIDANNRDNFPLMKPITSSNILPTPSPEVAPFSPTLVMAPLTLAAVVVGIGLLFYFKKRNR
jgi:parallel beta-helix repeat protein